MDQLDPRTLKKLQAVCLQNAGPDKGGMSVKEMKALTSALGLSTAKMNRQQIRGVLCGYYFPQGSAPKPKAKAAPKPKPATQPQPQPTSDDWWGAADAAVSAAMQGPEVDDWEALLDQHQQEQQRQQRQQRQQPQQRQQRQQRQQPQESQWQEAKSTKKAKKAAIKSVKPKKPSKSGMKTVKAGPKASSIQSKRVELLADRITETIMSSHVAIDAAINSDKPKAFFTLQKFRFPHQKKEEGEAIPRYFGDGDYDPKSGGTPMVALVRGYGIKVDPETKEKKRYEFQDNVLEELSYRFPEYTFGELYSRGRKMKDMETGTYYMRPGNNQVVIITNKEKWDAFVEKDSKKKQDHDVAKEVAKTYTYKRRGTRKPKQGQQRQQRQQKEEAASGFNLADAFADFPSLK